MINEFSSVRIFPYICNVRETDMKKGDIVKWKHPLNDLERHYTMTIESVETQNFVLVRHSNGQISHENINNLTLAK